VEGAALNFVPLSTFPVALVLVASVWVVGPEASGAVTRVEAEPNTIGSMSIRLDQPTPDYVTDVPAGRVLEPWETVQVLPLEVWRASLVMSEANQWPLLRITACESGGTWDTTLIGAAGEVGVAQVIPRFWGAVPADLRGQFEQADRIYTEHGDWPWTTRGGCDLWNS